MVGHQVYSKASDSMILQRGFDPNPNVCRLDGFSD